MNPRVEPLGDGERTWIQSHLRIAHSFVAEYAGIEPTNTLPTPEALDAAWNAWLPHWERHDPNHIINAVGMAIGEHLITTLGLRWVVATDEVGTELAVYSERCNVIVFPANLVGKRFQRRTISFIAPLLEQMCEDIQKLWDEERPN